MGTNAAAEAVKAELERLLVGQQLPATATQPVGKIIAIVMPDRHSDDPDSFFWEVEVEPVHDDGEGYWGQGLQTVSILSEAKRVELFRRHFGDLAR
jgi:hypothetical protein